MANTDLFSTNRIAGKTLSSPGKFIIFGLPPGTMISLPNELCSNRVRLV
jgi:hypothetical protein